MLRISKLTDHATRLMQALSNEMDAVLSATHLAQKTGIETATTSKLLKILSHAGLLYAARGANGGYRLAKLPAHISIADIVAAIEGPIAMTDCSHGVGNCEQESFCGTSRNWKLISLAVETALRNVSLADMSAPLPKNNANGLSKHSRRVIPTPIVLDNASIQPQAAVRQGKTA